MLRRLARSGVGGVVLLGTLPRTSLAAEDGFLPHAVCYLWDASLLTVHAVTEPRPGRRSLVDGELLAQGQVLEGELAVAADEEGKESEQVKYESDHERRLWPEVA